MGPISEVIVSDVVDVSAGARAGVAYDGGQICLGIESVINNLPIRVRRPEESPHRIVCRLRREVTPQQIVSRILWIVDRPDAEGLLPQRAVFPLFLSDVVLD